MGRASRTHVAHWFAGTETQTVSELHDHELPTHLETLRQLMRYSSALRVAVNGVEIDLGVRPSHVW